MEDILMQILKQLCNILVGAVVTGLLGYIKLQKERLKIREENERLDREVDRVILRNLIRQACKKRIREGWVALDEKDDIMACYEAYEKIIKREGIKNGVIDDCIAEFRKLPNIRKED